MTLGFPVTELAVPAIPAVEAGAALGRGNAGMIQEDESARI
jgi:hypothetical protein